MKNNGFKEVEIVYNDESYDTLMRFVSYYNQKKNIISIAKNNRGKKILEVGKGNGFLSDYLKKRGFDIKTFDYNKNVKPDFFGDIKKIENIIDEKFDIITCFEVLEHIKYEDVENVIKQFSQMTNEYLLISVPQCRLFFTLWIDVSVLHNHSFSFNIPIPLKHKFDGEHYWELGKKGYSVKAFRVLLKKYFDLEQEDVHPLNTYHRSFILKKKKI